MNGLTSEATGCTTPSIIMIAWLLSRGRYQFHSPQYWVHSYIYYHTFCLLITIFATHYCLHGEFHFFVHIWYVILWIAAIRDTHRRDNQSSNILTVGYTGFACGSSWEGLFIFFDTKSHSNLWVGDCSVGQSGSRSWHKRVDPLWDQIAALQDMSNM